MFSISEAFAQTTQATGGEPGLLANILPLVLIFAVFYFFLIRPQQQKLKQHQALVNGVKRGDEIVTGGGIIGKVSKVEENTNIAHVEIADGVVVKINKATIVDIIGAANNNKPEAANNAEEVVVAKTKKKKKG